MLSASIGLYTLFTVEAFEKTAINPAKLFRPNKVYQNQREISEESQSM